MPRYRTRLCIMPEPLCMCDLSAYSCVCIYTRPWCAVYGTQYCMSVYVHGVGVRYRGLPLCTMPASCRGLSAFVTCQPHCVHGHTACDEQSLDSCVGIAMRRWRAVYGILNTTCAVHDHEPCLDLSVYDLSATICTLAVASAHWYC